MTLLKAINQMLAVIGQAPLEDINMLSPEGELAQGVLLDESENVQSEGWSFNTEYRTKVAPDENGEITVGDDIITIDPQDPTIDAVQKGARLYNRNTNSFIFEAPLEVEIVRLLPFEDLPKIAQQYISIRAARRFQRNYLGSETINSITKEDESKALIRMEQFETRTGDFNVLRDNPRLSRAIIRNR